MRGFIPGVLVLASVLAAPAAGAAPFVFSTGNTDGKMAMASRPENGPNIEIEAADDFALTAPVSLTSATFVGLVPAGSNVFRVDVEIYRVFPADSDLNRTIQVLTRANSPSDNALTTRDSAEGTLSFTTTVLNANFTALNSVLNGIHKSPNQLTGGELAVSGQEVSSWSAIGANWP